MISPMLGDVALPTVSLVIVSYNVREHLRRCLRSAFASRDVTLEVIVVDNGSRDGSADTVAKEFPQVRLVRLPENRGYAAANNVGLVECRGSYVLLLNPDMFLDLDAVAQLGNFLMVHSEVGAVGPRILRPDGRPDPAARRAFPTPLVAALRMSGLSRLFPRSARMARYNLGHLSPESTHEIDSGTGACLLVRRSALNEVGLFDTDYFLYGEDIDLCLRLKTAGWAIYYLPTALGTHVKGASASQRPLESIYEFHRAMWTFYKKHYAFRYLAALRVIVWLAIWTRCCLMATRAALQLQWPSRAGTSLTREDQRPEEVPQNA